MSYTVTFLSTEKNMAACQSQGEQRIQTVVCLLAVCNQTSVETKAAMLFALLLILYCLVFFFFTCTISRICTFPKCVPHDSSTWPEDLFDCQTLPLSHRNAKKRKKKKKHTDLPPLTIHKHTHTHTYTLSSSSTLPLGVNTFCYLVDIYRRRINSSPLSPLLGPADTAPWTGMICRLEMGHQRLPSQSPPTCDTADDGGATAANKKVGQTKLCFKSHAAAAQACRSPCVSVWHFDILDVHRGLSVGFTVIVKHRQKKE